MGTRTEVVRRPGAPERAELSPEPEAPGPEAAERAELSLETEAAQAVVPGPEASLRVGHRVEARLPAVHRVEGKARAVAILWGAPGAG